MRKYFPYILLIIASGALIYTILKRYKSNEPENSKTINGKRLELTNVSIRNKAHKLGKLPISADVKTNFVLHNTGKIYLIVDKVEVSCKCTTGKISAKKVKPGDSVSLVVTYDKKRPGYFFQDVFVYGNFETSPEVLSFEGFLVDK